MGNRMKAYLFDLNSQKETEIGDIQGFSFSADNKK